MDVHHPIDPAVAAAFAEESFKRLEQEPDDTLPLSRFHILTNLLDTDTWDEIAAKEETRQRIITALHQRIAASDNREATKLIAKAVVSDSFGDGDGDEERD